MSQTRAAFDAVASEYDGALGNNHVIQRMRAALWKVVEHAVPVGSRLLDVGCGTGLDAVHFASLGYDVTAVDSSPEMASRSRERADRAALQERISVRVLSADRIGELAELKFGCIYSNLGPLNCLPNIRPVAKACAQLTRPGGLLVLSVIGRICPWEVLYYSAKLDWRRATLRFSRRPVSVPLRDGTIWTQYYTPGEFIRPFRESFEVVSYRPLCLFAPPPYLLGAWDRAARLCSITARLDAVVGSLPLLRNAGDHFLLVMRRKP